MEPNLSHLLAVTQNDVAELERRDQEYGGSWKKRGGVGAFMMLARKWDRLEKQAGDAGWDIFGAAESDPRQEGLIDDVRDLRRYLLLVETELIQRMEVRKYVLDASDARPK